MDNSDHKNKKNNLKASYPEIAAMWHPSMNGELLPSDISSGSKKRVWWNCSAGHSYQSPICDVVKGHGCPYCSGNRVLSGFNDIITKKPDLESEWDWDKNSYVDPRTVSYGSRKKYWWKCQRGHSFEASPNQRYSQDSGCPFCSGQRVLPGYNDLASTNNELIAEWDWKKNSLRPTEISKGSRKEVWWICPKGHSYKTQVYSRVAGHGCPICKGKKAFAGVNDFLSECPQLKEEWDCDKNKGTDPYSLTSGSGKNVWWICSMGHSYEMTIRQRTLGQGCPYCSNHKMLAGFNNLAFTNPELVQEWDTIKNKMPIESVFRGSEKQAWWVCPKGHSYRSLISHRVKGHGCPFCSGRSVLKGFNDILTTDPEKSKDWDYHRNADVDITSVSRGSGKSVWWICKKCGNSFQMPVDKYVATDRGCPICRGLQVVKGYNDLVTTDPEIAKQWDTSKNTDSASSYTRGSAKRVWWRCEKGHSWFSAINNRTAGRGCPECTKELQISFPEKAVYYYIKRCFPEAIENYRSPEKLELDIYIPDENVGIEYDGAFFHRSEEKDLKKDRLFADEGIRIIRIRENGCPPLDGGKSTIIERKDKTDADLEACIRSLLTELGCEENDVDIDRDRDEIYSYMRLFEKNNSLAERHPELLSEWDYEKNQNIKPEYVRQFSRKKVWWKCGKGHSFQMGIASRVAGSSCPYCSNHKVLAGFNDIKTTRPDLIEIWD